ncbi:MAG: VWA domain-containing protein [Spirochaetaceae bacterium]|nr:VWA domain-containing protein [Spirochaetaceae bacterium]
MKKDLTEIVFILDKSGSMSGLEKDTIGGYNSFLERQRKIDGEAFVSTLLFSDRSEVIHDRVPIEKVNPMTEEQYYVDGCTALLDAIGGAVHHIGNVHKYARDEDRPEKTVFVITTDGQENSSHKYTYDKIKKMIEHQQEKYGWEFLFLGANMDAISEASKLGIRQDRAVRYECDEVGTALNYECVCDTITDIRMGKAMSGNWKRRIDDYRKTKKS